MKKLMGVKMSKQGVLNIFHVLSLIGLIVFLSCIGEIMELEDYLIVIISTLSPIILFISFAIQCMIWKKTSKECDEQFEDNGFFYE